eukprot:6198114-Pleurochrysis_carterae.AAC.1
MAGNHASRQTYQDSRESGRKEFWSMRQQQHVITMKRDLGRTPIGSVWLHHLHHLAIQMLRSIRTCSMGEKMAFAGSGAQASGPVPHSASEKSCRGRPWRRPGVVQTEPLSSLPPQERSSTPRASEDGIAESLSRKVKESQIEKNSPPLRKGSSRAFCGLKTSPPDRLCRRWRGSRAATDQTLPIELRR